MKNILKIFIDDVKRIRKNVIAMIVEYLHEEMKKKSVLGEMSSEELMKILKEENSK